MAKTAVSGFAAKLGKAGLEAFEEFKDEEIVVGSAGECPPIPNGIAQLVDIHLGEYKSGKNQGKPFAYLGAVVISPEYVNTEDGKLKSAGTQTNQTIPLCDTVNYKGEKKSFKQNYAEFLNALKKLGLETKGLTGNALDTAIAALVASKPYFVFNVTQSAPTPAFPSPGKFHNWGLADPNYEDKTDPDAGVVEEASNNGKTTGFKKTATSTKPETKPAAKGKKVAPKEEVPFGDDLDMTADKADEGDEAAKEWLGTRAMELGCTEEEVEGTENWQEVAEMIRAKESGETEEESSDEEEAVDYDALAEQADAEDEEAIEAIKTWAAEFGEDADDHSDKSWVEFVTYIKENYETEAEAEEPEELVPEKGGVYEAKVGKNKKASQVEVIIVKTKDKTVNVKDLNDNKIYPNIPWSALSEVS